MTTVATPIRLDVEFDSDGTRCSAWHYPSQSDQVSSACIVMAHGLGGTRECGLAPYAERFAAEGYHVLVFDYRYFGDSDGEPRTSGSDDPQEEQRNRNVDDGPGGRKEEV